MSAFSKGLDKSLTPLTGNIYIFLSISIFLSSFTHMRYIKVLKQEKKA